MPRVLTLALENRSTHVMNIHLDTTRVISIPPPPPSPVPRVGLNYTLIGLNQTESVAWAAAVKSPQVAQWTGDGQLIITDIVQAPEDARREIL
jgi:hypothetical protein